MHGLALPRRVLDAVLRYALPPRCPGCGAIVGADHSFCLPCWQSLDFLAGPSCAVCAEPLELALHDDARCGACLADPPPFRTLRAAVAYGPIARALALKLKYGRRPGVAQTMARLMLRHARMEDALIAPVPLHRRRLWWRGYNQSALIARALVRMGGGTLAVDLLTRTKPTPLLRGLGRKARARAVAGAFQVTPAQREHLKGQRVILIDNVYTSGATAHACAITLRRAGAGAIDILCWARVVRDQGDMR